MQYYKFNRPPTDKAVEGPASRTLFIEHKQKRSICMEARSRHPYQPFVPENATKLIIGSIPPFRFCEASNRKLYSDDVDFTMGHMTTAFGSFYPQ